MPTDGCMFGRALSRLTFLLVFTSVLRHRLGTVELNVDTRVTMVMDVWRFSRYSDGDSFSHFD